MKILLFTFLLLIGNNGFAQTKRPGDQVASEIAASNILYFKAFSEGNSSLFIDRYSTDCCIMPPGMQPLCGDLAAKEFFKVAYNDMAIRGGRFITLEIYGSGNEGYVTEEGTFELYDGAVKLIDKGKYLVLWKKTPSGWKMFRDSFSSNHVSQP